MGCEKCSSLEKQVEELKVENTGLSNIAGAEILALHEQLTQRDAELARYKELVKLSKKATPETAAGLRALLAQKDAEIERLRFNNKGLNDSCKKHMARIGELEKEKPFPLDAYYAVERDNLVIRELLFEMAEVLAAVKNDDDMNLPYGPSRETMDSVNTILTKFNQWRQGK